MTAWSGSGLSSAGSTEVNAPVSVFPSVCGRHGGPSLAEWLPTLAGVGWAKRVVCDRTRREVTWLPVLQGSEPSYLDRTEQLQAVLCSTMEKVGGASGGAGPREGRGLRLRSVLASGGEWPPSSTPQATSAL